MGGPNYLYICSKNTPTYLTLCFLMQKMIKLLDKVMTPLGRRKLIWIGAKKDPATQQMKWVNHLGDFDG